MAIRATQKVGELAVEFPDAIPLFEGLGIDYCCGGDHSLEEACLASGVPPKEVIERIETSLASKEGVLRSKEWSREPLSELTAHIVNRHHGYVRDELRRLGVFLEKVCAAHGQNHPELLTIHELFSGLSEEMTMHMYKEENILFPYIELLEAATRGGRALTPPPFGTVQNPIHMMETEHEIAAQHLRGMREASGNFKVPPDGCTSYQILYKGLIDFEQDLHLHIHLENNILFPRAKVMEAEWYQKEDLSNHEPTS
ncbi:MAG: iron-sulfur cluster repair di-iron protein [Terriglobia bacterium]